METLITREVHFAWTPFVEVQFDLAVDGPMQGCASKGCRLIAGRARTDWPRDFVSGSSM